MEVEMSVAPGSVTLDGERSGVELSFDEGGGGRQIRVGFIERDGLRRIALQLSNGTFTDGITIDWASTTIVRLERRGTDGVVTAGGPGGQEHAVPLALLALAAYPSPTFEFGCASGPGSARLSVGPIGDVPIRFNPMVDPLQQGYATEGGAPYATGPRLRIDDASPDRRLFYTSISHLGSGPLSVDVDVRLEGTPVPDGEDTGVHFVLNNGEAIGSQIRVACIRRGLERRLAVKGSTGTFTAGLPCDWTTAVTFRIERGAAGEGILTFNGQQEVIPSSGLTAATRVEPTFEFGCVSGPATVTATFGPIGQTGPVVFPMTLTPAHAVLIPNRIQGVALDGAFQLDADSDGIDPVADGVALELSTPGGAFYPIGADVMPVGMRIAPGGWRITDAERARTGIEVFLIQRTADPTRFRYVLLDGRSRLPAADYSHVRLDLAIGDDEAAADMTLVAGRRGIWFLP